MKEFRIEDMVKGWFVGDFEPSALRTTGCEVAFKEYREGDTEPRHVHKIATEITVVVAGLIEMNGKKYLPNRIIVVEPGEAVEFRAVCNSETICVKIPSVKGDKYDIGE